MVVRVTGGLRPPCPVGISGWLKAASVDPSGGQSHDPLILAVIDFASGTNQRGELPNFLSQPGTAMCEARLGHGAHGLVAHRMVWSCGVWAGDGVIWHPFGPERSRWLVDGFARLVL